MRFLSVLGVVFVLVVGFLGGFFIAQSRAGSEIDVLNNKIHTLELQVDKYKIVRTQGGELLLGKLVKSESSIFKESWDCFPLPAPICKLLGTGNTKISGKVHYSYKVPLSEFWVLERIDVGAVSNATKYRLRVPRPKAELPVAIDVSSIQVDYQGKLLAPGPNDQQVMQNRMQPDMDKRANSLPYLQAIDGDAKKTVEEFARKWMRDGDFKIPEGAVIEVEFTAK